MNFVKTFQKIKEKLILCNLSVIAQSPILCKDIPIEELALGSHTEPVAERLERLRGKANPNDNLGNRCTAAGGLFAIRSDTQYMQGASI
jgi:hypothetical protein